MIEPREVNICPKAKYIFSVTPKLKSVFSKLSSKINYLGHRLRYHFIRLSGARESTIDTKHFMFKALSKNSLKWTILCQIHRDAALPAQQMGHCCQEKVKSFYLGTHKNSTRIVRWIRDTVGSL